MENKNPPIPTKKEKPSHFHLENKLNPSSATGLPRLPSDILIQELWKGSTISKPVPPLPGLIRPPSGALSGMPSPEAQSWGAVISIVIIVLMIVIGAFYAWGERIAQERALIAPASTQY